MKDRLSGYRNAMDRSVFKDQKFTQHHRQEVFKKIKKSKKKREDWLPRTLSVVFGTMVLLIGGHYLLEVISDSADHANHSQVLDPVFNGNEDTPLSTEEEAILESPYKEIKDHFDSWELPEEGRVESTEMINGIEYDNGYIFDQDTKVMIGRIHTEDGPAEPTENQKIGVIMGFLVDAAAIQDPENRTISNASGQMYHPLSRLEQIKELNEFKPLEDWVLETEEILNKVENSETEEEREKFYTLGYEKLQEMNSLIEGKTKIQSR